MEKEKQFLCGELSINFFGYNGYCKQSFDTKEELSFHKHHNCPNDSKEKYKCRNLKSDGHCFCIEKLQEKVINPILFFCLKCKINHNSYFLFNYHNTHTCVNSVNNKDCCIEFYDTNNCLCLKDAEEKVKKWKRENIVNNVTKNVN